MLTIGVNKVVVSGKVLCNNREDWRYIVGYQAYKETIILLFTKTPKNIFNYGVPQYHKHSLRLYNII